jgi:hypothetical protein
MPQEFRKPSHKLNIQMRRLIPNSPLASFGDSGASTFTKSRYSGFHICFRNPSFHLLLLPRDISNTIYILLSPPAESPSSQT